MKPYPLAPDAPAEAAGEWLAEHDWKLPDVLEWFAGKPCPEYHSDVPGFGLCPRCYADPPAEYARDVLYWFIKNDGATHPRHEAMAEEIKTLRWPGWVTEATAKLAMKHAVLRFFSGPVNDEECDLCHGWKSVKSCTRCNNSGVIPGGGVRIDCPCDPAWVSSEGMYAFPVCLKCIGHGKIKPEQLLPLEPGRETYWATLQLVPGD